MSMNNIGHGIKPMSKEEAGKRRKRSIVIGWSLFFLLILFYVVTMIQFTNNRKIPIANEVKEKGASFYLYEQNAKHRSKA